MSTQIRMKCNKLEQQTHYSKKEDGSNNVQTTARLYVAYCIDPKDPNYPYAQLSGGSIFPLTTINEEAAKQFELDGEYMITIERIK